MARNENQRDNNSKSNETQTKSNISKKLVIHDNVKTGIDGSNRKTKFYQNGRILFGLLKFETDRNVEFEPEIILLTERTDRGREFNKFRTSKNCVLSLVQFVW